MGKIGTDRAGTNVSPKPSDLVAKDRPKTLSCPRLQLTDFANRRQHEGFTQKEMFLDGFSLFLGVCLTPYFCPLALAQLACGTEGFDDYIVSDQLTQFSGHFGHGTKRMDGRGLKCLHEQLLDFASERRHRHGATREVSPKDA